jgi:hypothetical protein
MKYIDNFLADVGLTRRDMDIRWRMFGGRYRIKSFTLLWCIVELVGLTFAMFGTYAFFVVTILMFG